jgi:hypothetical protein
LNSQLKFAAQFGCVLSNSLNIHDRIIACDKATPFQYLNSSINPLYGLPAHGEVPIRRSVDCVIAVPYDEKVPTLLPFANNVIVEPERTNARCVQLFKGGAYAIDPTPVPEA